MFKLFKALFLMTILIISFSCQAKVLQFGIIAHSPDTHILKELHETEAKVIQNALHQQLQFHFFYNYTEVVDILKKQPKKYSFLYAKEGLVPQLKTLGNWEKIAQLLERNPETNKLSPTYSSYLITAKKSNINALKDLTHKKIVYFNADSASNYTAIKQLLREKKITSVQWIKVETMAQALSMVASGKADAMGVWGYYFAHSKDKNKFNIFYKIDGLENPILYGNTKNLNPEEMSKIKTALQQESTQHQAAFTYHFEKN